MNLKKLKSLPFHPFLFAVYPTLFLYSYNKEEVTFLDFLSPALVIVFSSLFIYLIFWKLTKNPKKAAIITSILLIFFFSYGHFTRFIKAAVGVRVLEGVFKPRYMLPLWTLFFAALTFYFLRLKKKLHKPTQVLNLVSLFLILAPLFNLITYKPFLPQQDTETVASQFKTEEQQESQPDIYYIILDAYASDRVLKDIYEFDNSDFISYLENKDFYIPPRTRSNYVSTTFSLASSLNIRHVTNLPEIVGEESRDVSLPYKMIENNEVLKFLKDRGYTYIHFSSGWGPTNYNPQADINMHTVFVDEFIAVLARTTVLSPFEFTKPFMSKRILFTFEKLKKVPSYDSPKFVLAHILFPHPPWLFDADGELLRKSKVRFKGNVWKQKEAYSGQVAFANKKIKEVVDTILTSSDSPLIIIQGDHGTDFNEGSYTEERFLERTGILNAYFLPGKTDILYESITPVNTFRVIFNEYFNQEFELLDDISYYIEPEKPYKFIDITDYLNENYETSSVE